MHARRVRYLLMTAIAAALFGALPAVSMAQRPPVPALPPHSVSATLWDSVHAPANMVQPDEHLGHPYARSLLLVWFHGGATQPERQAAIDAVDGTLIGGISLTRGGIYYVRIEDDGTTGPLWKAIEKLKTLLQVEDVHPDLAELSGS
jgi:hypothetical protein